MINNRRVSNGWIFLAAVVLSGCGQQSEPAKSSPAAQQDSQSQTQPSLALTPKESPGPLSTERPAETRDEDPIEAKNESEALFSDDPAELQEATMDALDSGDLDTAFRCIRAAKRLAPDDPQTVFLMGRVLAERNRFAEAVKLLDDLALTVPPTRLPVMGQTAEWLVFDGQWDEAERRYRDLIEELDDAGMVHRRLAPLLLRQGRRLEALTHLRELCRAGNIEEAELRSMLSGRCPFPDPERSDENDPIGRLGNAREQLGQGKLDAALQALSPSESLSEAESALRGRLLAERGDLKALSDWVAENDAAEPLNADHWFAIGVDQADKGQHREAVHSFCQAVLRDQTDAKAYKGLSRALKALEWSDHAETASRRAGLVEKTQRLGHQLAIDPDRDLNSLSELSETLQQLNRPMESLAWKAVETVYAQAAGKLTKPSAVQTLQEINRERVRLIEEGQVISEEEFVVCGVDLDSLANSDP